MVWSSQYLFEDQWNCRISQSYQSKKPVPQTLHVVKESNINHKFLSIDNKCIISLPKMMRIAIMYCTIMAGKTNLHTRKYSDRLSYRYASKNTLYHAGLLTKTGTLMYMCSEKGTLMCLCSYMYGRNFVM